MVWDDKFHFYISNFAISNLKLSRSSQFLILAGNPDLDLPKTVLSHVL